MCRLKQQKEEEEKKYVHLKASKLCVDDVGRPPYRRGEEWKEDCGVQTEQQFKLGNKKGGNEPDSESQSSLKEQGKRVIISLPCGRKTHQEENEGLALLVNDASD